MIRSYRLNHGEPMGSPQSSKVRSMTFLLFAFLVGFTVLTGFVLADSGLRVWSAAGELASQRRALAANSTADLPGKRTACTARVSSVRVSYARPARMRAAA